ncbi:DUF2243 domain-containing protein [Pseudescherichia vulneris]|uniref:DUF2243 domain-containing protein n=1 Tax=Pseudescherichia vulneris TaxID=566 RepID=UPI00227AF05A|nr:DUF2243 domain-containing protein [Pseudescherichia vulneris]WAH53205.1 DUF2243 domain-containing protein [Pseudescherichia vulneris]
MPPLTSSRQSDLKRSLTATVPLGIGMMAAIDEVVFHQLLAWHHFFDWGTPAFSLLSDGLLHSAELILFVLGFFMFSRLYRRGVLNQTAAWAGFILGMGAFQLFDGIVDHKLLRLHQIRYVENVLLYDIVWNGVAVLLLLVGYLLFRRARRTARG